MKRNALFRIILWSVTVFILIGLLIGGLGIGYFVKNNGFDAENWSFSFGTGGDYYGKDSSFKIGSTKISENISDLEIYWRKGNVEITVYDGDTLLLIETELSHKDELMRYRVNNARLEIHPRKSSVFMGLRGTPSKDLTVKVPASMVENLNKITVSVASANVQINDLKIGNVLSIDSASGATTLKNVSAKAVNFDNVSGEIKAENIVTESVACDNVSGNVNLKGEIGAISFDSVSGDLSLESSVMLREAESDTVSGNVNLVIPENTGFELDFDSVSGKVSSDFGITLVDENEYNYGSGEAEFSFDSVSGDLNIKKLSQ